MRRRYFIALLMILAFCLSLGGCKKDDEGKGSGGDGKDVSGTPGSDGYSGPVGTYGAGLADPNEIYDAGQLIQLDGSQLYFISIEDGSDWLDSTQGLGAGEKYISVPVEYTCYEDNVDEDIPDPAHVYLTQAKDSDGNDLNLGGRLQPVTDMPDSEIESRLDSYYRASVPMVPDSSSQMEVWALYKVPEETAECVIEVYLTDDFNSPHSGAFRIKIKENDNYGTFEEQSADELSKMLATDEEPSLDDFAWFTNELAENLRMYPVMTRDADYEAGNYLGGWKCYMYHDLENAEDGYSGRLCNVYIDNYSPEEKGSSEEKEIGFFDVRIKWYLGFDGDGNVIDESDIEDTVIKHEYFTWNRMNNEDDEKGIPELSFHIAYGAKTAIGRGLYKDSELEYQIVLVRPDGLKLGGGKISVMPGTKDVPVPASLAANMKDSGSRGKGSGRDDSGSGGDEDGRGGNGSDGDDKPHYGPAAAARDKAANGEDGDEPEDDSSFGRGPAAKGRERDTWGNGYHEPTEDDYINWDTSGDEKYYSGKKGYVIAGSDTEILDKNSVKNLSDEDLRLAINEIYARHGRKFKSEELQKYFDNKAWYTPKYEPDEFDKKQNSILNDVEKKNLKTLTEIRSERGN